MADTPTTQKQLEDFVNTYPTGRTNSLYAIDTKELDGYISRRDFVIYASNPRQSVAHILYHRADASLHQYFLTT